MYLDSSNEQRGDERSNDGVNDAGLVRSGGNYLLQDSKPFDDCPFCETKILSSENKCNVCRASIQYIREFLIAKEKQSHEDILDKWKCDKCGLLIESSVTVCRMCSKLLKEGGCETENELADKDCRFKRSDIKDNDVEDYGQETFGNGNRTVERAIVKLITMQEIYEGIKNTDDTELIKYCVFCGENLFDNEAGCSVCGATIDEIKEEYNMIEDKNNDNVVFIGNKSLDVRRDVGNVYGGDNKTEEGAGYGEYMKKDANIKKWTCGGCELLNEYSVVTCVVCYGLYKDGRWICGRCKAVNSGIADRCDNCNKRNKNLGGDKKTKAERVIDASYKRVDKIDGKTDINNVAIKKVEKSDANSRKKGKEVEHDFCMTENIKKWKCSGCGLLNEYSVMTCVACYGLYKHGKWICELCKTENKGEDNCCSNCERMNVNNKVNDGDNKAAEERRVKIAKIGGQSDIVDREKDIHIPVDEWRCGDCNTRQSYKYIKCELCDRSRRVSGVWMCARCTMINKTNVDKCSVCGELNDHLTMKLCIYCKTNEVSEKAIQCKECVLNPKNQWKCGYRKCESMNLDNDEYCCKCQYWRDNTYGRGDRCKQKGLFVEAKTGWICYKCDNFNELSKERCTKDTCNETRYAKVLP